MKSAEAEATSSKKMATDSSEPEPSAREEGAKTNSTTKKDNEKNKKQEDASEEQQHQEATARINRILDIVNGPSGSKVTTKGKGEKSYEKGYGKGYEKGYKSNEKGKGKFGKGDGEDSNSRNAILKAPRGKRGGGAGGGRKTSADYDDEEDDYDIPPWRVKKNASGKEKESGEGDKSTNSSDKIRESLQAAFRSTDKTDKTGDDSAENKKDEKKYESLFEGEDEDKDKTDMSDIVDFLRSGIESKADSNGAPASFSEFRPSLNPNAAVFVPGGSEGPSASTQPGYQNAQDSPPGWGYNGYGWTASSDAAESSVSPTSEAPGGFPEVVPGFREGEFMGLQSIAEMGEWIVLREKKPKALPFFWNIMTGEKSWEAPQILKELGVVDSLYEWSQDLGETGIMPVAEALYPDLYRRKNRQKEKNQGLKSTPLAAGAVKGSEQEEAPPGFGSPQGDKLEGREGEKDEKGEIIEKLPFPENSKGSRMPFEKGGKGGKGYQAIGKGYEAGGKGYEAGGKGYEEKGEKGGYRKGKYRSDYEDGKGFGKSKNEGFWRPKEPSPPPAMDDSGFWKPKEPSPPPAPKFTMDDSGPWPDLNSTPGKGSKDEKDEGRSKTDTLGATGDTAGERWIPHDLSASNALNIEVPKLSTVKMPLFGHSRAFLGALRRPASNMVPTDPRLAKGVWRRKEESANEDS